MTKKLKNLLPKKLSDCLEVALQDLADSVKSGYKVDMSRWYTNDGDNCIVCLAGSVLAKEFDLEPGEALGPSGANRSGLITDHDYERLCALNELRIGLVQNPLRRIGVENSHAYEWDMPAACEGEGYTLAWRKDMKNIVKYLRSRGQ